VSPWKRLFKNVVSVMKTQVDEKTIDLAMGLPQDLPDVKADANKISWVLTNLVANALRYTDLGGHIRVSAEKLDPMFTSQSAMMGPAFPTKSNQEF